MRPEDVGLWLSKRALSVDAEPMQESALDLAAHCLLDWGVLVKAAWEEESIKRLRECLASDANRGAGAGAGDVTLIGDASRAPMDTAITLNGTAGHLLDFDDAHLKSRVHPSVPLWPALLAESERLGRSGRALLSAFVAGVEVQSRLAYLLGPPHYRLGWHSTATLGCIGTAAAICVLRNADLETTRQALGVAASQSSGLRAVFGSPVKPYQVARASASGWHAACVASCGIGSVADVIGEEGGYLDLYATPDCKDVRPVAGDDWCIYDTVFKYHASCYGTQAPIEAALALPRLAGDEVESIEIQVEPQYLSVCNIKTPRDATQAKFSISHMVALALAGWDTAHPASFASAAIDAEEIGQWRERIHVVSSETIARANARIVLRRVTGETLTRSVDASLPEHDAARREARLLEKSRALLTSSGLCKSRTDEVLSHWSGVKASDDVSAFMAEYRRVLTD